MLCLLKIVTKNDGKIETSINNKKIYFEIKGAFLEFVKAT